MNTILVFNPTNKVSIFTSVISWKHKDASVLIGGMILSPKVRRLLLPREGPVGFVNVFVLTPSEQIGARASDDPDAPLDLDNDSSQLLRRLRERLQRYDALPQLERLPL